MATQFRVFKNIRYISILMRCSSKRLVRIMRWWFVQHPVIIWTGVDLLSVESYVFWELHFPSPGSHSQLRRLPSWASVVIWLYLNKYGNSRHLAYSKIFHINYIIDRGSPDLVMTRCQIGDDRLFDGCISHCDAMTCRDPLSPLSAI